MAAQNAGLQINRNAFIRAMYNNNADNSARRLALATNMSYSAINNMIRSGYASPQTTVAQICRLAEAVGLTTAEMLTPEESLAASSDKDPADASRLARVLIVEQRQQLHDHLCSALHWTRDRLDEATERLDQSLHATGMRIHANFQGITIRPIDQTETTTTDALGAMRVNRDGLSMADARIMHSMIHGKYTTRDIPAGVKPRLAMLQGLGILDLYPGDCLGALTPEAAFAFKV